MIRSLTWYSLRKRSISATHWSGVPKNTFCGIRRPAASRAEWRRSAAAEGERRAQRIYGQWLAASEDRMREQLAEGKAAGRLIPQKVFFGTPDQCISEIERFQREYHVTDLIIRGVFPGQAPEEELPNLVRFASEVIPHFRRA